MAFHSAGILLFRYRKGVLEVFLVHPGGPFWSGRDEGAWSIPKGLCRENETPLEAARREFREETGFAVDGDLLELGQIKQPSGKIVHVWATEKNVDETRVSSNDFTLEWPRKSGHLQVFPEVDRAGWFDLAQAKNKILKGQAGFLDRLVERLGHSAGNA